MPTLIDFIIQALCTPSSVWVGTIIGILVASVVWALLPATVDRASICGWIVAAGFVGGIFFGLSTKKEK